MYRLGVNKTPPNFETLVCDPFMDRSVSLKGSVRHVFMGRSAASGLAAASPTSATTRSPFVDTTMKIQLTKKVAISRENHLLKKDSA